MQDMRNQEVTFYQHTGSSCRYIVFLKKAIFGRWDLDIDGFFVVVILEIDVVIRYRML